MFPAATKGGGMAFAFPDILKIPAPPAPFAPAPFPNMGQLPTAILTTLKVKIMNMPAIHKGSKIPLTNGGEPGVLKGLQIPNQLGEVEFKMGSMKVKTEGQPLVLLLGLTGQNGPSSNAPVGMVQVVANMKVIVLG